MPTKSQVHTALDNLTTSVFSGYTIIFSNQENHSPSEGILPYIKQKVSFNSYVPTSLGVDTCKQRRVRGYILFIIHSRVGSGEAQRNAIESLIDSNFTVRVIGGATMEGSRKVSELVTEGWSIVGVQVPFFFDLEEI